METDISEIKSLSDLKESEVWAEQAKRFYFKDTLSAYIEEIQELLKEHKERLYERKDLHFGDCKKIQ